MTKVQHCDECRYWHGFVGIPGERCDKGHQPRFYMPRGPMDQEFGYKRRCADYEQSRPAGQKGAAA